MKIITLIRHGEAEMGTYASGDKNRNLTPYGIQQCSAVKNWLSSKNLNIEAVIHSSAKRTTQTAQHIFNQHTTLDLSVFSTDKLYLCAHNLYDEIICTNESLNPLSNIAIVGHNPGISDYLNEKTQTAIYHHLSTCGTAILKFDIHDWSEIFTAKANIIYLNQ